MTATRFIALLLVVAGAVLVVAPTLVHDPGPAANTFEAIERRIPWGGLLGLGALVLLHRNYKPWPNAVAGFVLWVVAGLLVARLVGLVLDGADVPMQWVWVVVEAAIVVGAWVFLRWRARRAAQS